MRVLPLACLVLLAACGGPTMRYAVPPSAPEARVGIAYSSIEVSDVSLPTYAQLEEIYVETADGALSPVDDLLWADDPARAASLELVRALSSVTGARVAGEPWPFDSYPDARLEVRVEEFVASRRGAFRMSGQYFVAALDGSSRDRARTFSLSVPLSPEAGAPEIATARGQAMARLAEIIAREGLS